MNKDTVIKVHYSLNEKYSCKGSGEVLDNIIQNIESGDRKYEQVAAMNKVSQLVKS